ncbi:GNAT family N-acetyltransferase [Enterococcus sp. ALS3]|uniref:GNAT family N-acetyltransferase n=1 Tax=Enterococcus alishanensis TaxID=1303817 RepID=A0ABS6TDA4_9ENTE|nr:GNAT family N-acetyltransferase [Enterococcus alishanensis]MBV7390903.1 GNAT family N-acetyltransferase [Enterococcus alishanensis]
MREIIKIKDQPELKELAANWFHHKWGVPLEAYFESIETSISGKTAVPQWYGMFSKNKMIAGIGVIENDFHNRQDLTPNICSLYVEEEYRNQGIAGEMLDFVCQDMKNQGIETLYLLTDHQVFYEKYQWEFYTLAQPEETQNPSRIYRHRFI